MRTSAASSPANAVVAQRTRFLWRPGMTGPGASRCAASRASPSKPDEHTPRTIGPRRRTSSVTACRPLRVSRWPDGVREPQVTGRGRQAAQHPNFHWVNTMLGTIKNAIRGTYHAVSPKHASHYRAAFEDRFNRRFNRPRRVERLTRDAVQTPPTPYRFLKMTEETR